MEKFQFQEHQPLQQNTDKNYSGSCVHFYSGLFLIYINDICKAVPDTKVKLYVDDTDLFLFDRSYWCK